MLKIAINAESQTKFGEIRSLIQRGISKPEDFTTLRKACAEMILSNVSSNDRAAARALLHEYLSPETLLKFYDKMQNHMKEMLLPTEDLLLSVCFDFPEKDTLYEGLSYRLTSPALLTHIAKPMVKKGIISASVENFITMTAKDKAILFTACVKAYNPKKKAFDLTRDFYVMQKVLMDYQRAMLLESFRFV